MADFFSTRLLGCEWRGIGFPVSSFHTKMTQSIAQHARPDQDGARVESTGRNPLTFSATIPFRVSLAKGPNETWRSLYPDGWRAFLTAMSDRSVGTLQHPSMGKITCKPVSADSAVTAQIRDGEDVQAEWIEFSDDEETSNAIFARQSPIGGAVLEATNLDTQLAKHAAIKARDPDDKKISFEEALRRITGAVDSASLISRQIFGIIDRVVYRLDNISEAIRGAADPQNWPAKESIARLRASLFRLRRQALKFQNDTRFFIVPGDTTLATLAPRLKNKTTDLVHLNPTLVNSPLVTRGTAVRYYVAV